MAQAARFAEALGPRQDVARVALISCKHHAASTCDFAVFRAARTIQPISKGKGEKKEGDASVRTRKKEQWALSSRANHSYRLEKVASSRSRGLRQGIGLANAPSPSPVTIGDRGRKRSPHHNRSAPRGARPAPRLLPTPKILGQETRRSTAQSVFQPATLRASYGGSRSPPSKPANPSYTRWRFFVPCEKPL